MKSGQLIYHEKFFFQKSYLKRGEDTVPRSLVKKSKLNMSLDQYSTVLYSVFIVCQVEGYPNILK